MARETDKQKLKRLIETHCKSQIDVSWIGSVMDDDEYQAIIAKAARDENALNKFVDKLFEDK